MNIDLHSHSTISDGMLTPDEVAVRAKEHGVDVWALTDHDEISGIPLARAKAQAIGLQHIAGVEISVTWAQRTLHIIGLKIDIEYLPLVEGLHKTRAGRVMRAHAMAQRLQTLGIPDTFAGALTFVNNPELISRTHFARYLLQKKICATMQEVFDRYLGDGKPAYVENEWATLSDAVHWITGANGTAVIAHPARYKLSELELSILLDEFKQLGGTGIEVITGSHTLEDYQRFAQIAKKYQLLASRGSDFHAPNENGSKNDLGQLPALPDFLTPVWHDWF